TTSRAFALPEPAPSKPRGFRCSWTWIPSGAASATIASATISRRHGRRSTSRRVWRASACDVQTDVMAVDVTEKAEEAGWKPPPEGADQGCELVLPANVRWRGDGRSRLRPHGGVHRAATIRIGLAPGIERPLLDTGHLSHLTLPSASDVPPECGDV